MEKSLDKFTDLELAKLQGQVYQQLMQAQGNLLAINQEIEKRTPSLPTVSPEVAKEVEEANKKEK